MFKPTRTRKITNNFYVCRTLFVNFYVYNTGKNLLIFDTGINSVLSNLALKKLNLSADNVSHIFLTHSDYDHLGGRKLYKNAKIYLSKDEEIMITGKKSRQLGILYNTKIPDYNCLADGESLDIDGVNVKFVLTPGHTPGSGLYIINDEILIGGDTLSLSFKGEIRSFSFIQNMDNKKNKETVKKLKTSGIFDNKKIIATGHYGILEK